MRSAIKRRIRNYVLLTVSMFIAGWGPVAQLSVARTCANTMSVIATAKPSLLDPDATPPMPHTMSLPAQSIVHKMSLPAHPIVAGDRSLGYLAGNGNVTPRGEYEYSIPIDVPPGRAGMEPKLSLQYSSRGGNGVLGVGWSLAGFSSITRCHKTLSSEGAVDGVDFDPAGADSDHYCLDGKKLVVISGSYGENNAEYRTEQDTFSQIVSTTTNNALGPVSFTVKLKNGLIRTYKPASVKRYSATKTAMTSLGSVYERWLLVSEVDRSGNSVEFSYTTLDDGNLGVQYLPESINYTRHTSWLFPNRSVRFAYEDRPDVEFSWEAGVRTSLKKRLRSITMSAPAPGKVAPVWVYNFTYTTSDFSNRSLLSSVQKCGLPGNTCTWKKQFDWHMATPAPSWEHKYFDSEAFSYKYVTPNCYYDRGLFPLLLTLDADGDGADDILLQRGPIPSLSNPDVLLYTGLKGYGNKYHVGDNGSTFTSDMTLDLALPADLDGDGTSEVFTTKYVGGQSKSQCDDKIVHWTGSKFQTMLTLPVDNCSGTLIAPRPGLLLDLDGNRILDLVLTPDVIISNLSKTHVWATSLNLGGSFEKPPYSKTPIERDPRITVAVDFDGDGRVEIFGKDLKTRRTATYGMADGGGWQEFVDTDGRFPPVFDPSGQAFNLFGDFNGDGLQDSIHYQPGSPDHVIGGVRYGDLRWNTGHGFSPPDKVFIDELEPGRREVKVRVADMNRDGRDDLVVFHHLPTEGITILLSRGNGGFTPSFPTGTKCDENGCKPWNPPGLWLSNSDSAYCGSIIPPGDPYTTSKIGDFNGDGFSDIVRLTDAVCTQQPPWPEFDCSSADVRALIQIPHYADLLKSVKDEPTLWPRETVTYSTQWSDKPEPVTPCVYPKRCIKRGLTVVRELELRGHLIDPTNPATAAHKIYYSYEDPVTDLRGRGFLGFRKFRVWDPSRPMETVTTFDNHATWSAKGAYPYAMRATMVRTVVPLNPAAPVAGVPPTIASVAARVVQVEYTNQVKVLNSGLSYVDLPNTWVSQEWEENVSIDWGALDPEPLNPTSEHIFDIDETSPKLRSRAGSESYDDYGNEIASVELTLGGASFQVNANYDNLTSNWLIGLLRQRTVTTQEAGGTAVTRTMNYDYDEKGRLAVIYREKNNADTTLRRTTTLTLDDYGMLTKVVKSVANPAIPARETRIEYTPVWPNQPNERIFPSQIWQPFAPLQYRPSIWTAYHPAYGVLSAVMDANGVITQSVHDELGRLVTAYLPGAPTLSVSYAGRTDAYGGFNGMARILKMGGKQVERTSDGLGRQIKTSYKAFDGTLVYDDVSYDVLGRVISDSRPYQGTQASYKTIWTYDPLNRPLKAVLPDNNNVTFRHSFFVSKIRDAAGNQRSAERDVNDRIIKTVGMLGALPVNTIYEFEHFGLLHQVTDDKGHRTTYTHDLLGRRTFEDDPDAGQSRFVYNGFDELVSKTHVNSNQLTKYEYDDLGRSTGQVGPDGTLALTWDTQPNGIGKLATATSPDLVRSTFAYDAYGRSTGHTERIGGTDYTVSILYDPQGRVQELRYPSIDATAAPGLTLKYTYNAADYLKEIGYIANAAPYTMLWQVKARNLDGRLLQGHFGNGLDAVRTYFPEMGLIQNVQVKNSVAPVYDLTYSYYANGLVRGRIDSVANRSEAFLYDTLGRLTRWIATYNATTRMTDYDYDTDGNLLDVKLNQSVIEQNTYGQGGSMPHALTNQLVDGAVSTNYAYDTHGRQIAGGDRKITQYSDLNLPKQVTQSGQIWTLSYDAFGGRAMKRGPSSDTLYVGGLYERRIEGGQASHVFHVSGPDGGIAEISRANPSSPLTVNYLLNDALGSVGAIANNAGSVTGRFYFEPFGKRINADGTTFPSKSGGVKKGFTGHEHDYELGLINMRGRVYDPALKRMLTPDPLVSSPFYGQSWNPYSYVMNSPLNFTDPSGFDIQLEEDCMAWDDNSHVGHCHGGGVPEPQPKEAEEPKEPEEQSGGNGPTIPSGNPSIGTAAGNHGGGGPSPGGEGGNAKGNQGAPVQSSNEGYYEFDGCGVIGPRCCPSEPPATEEERENVLQELVWAQMGAGGAPPTLTELEQLRRELGDPWIGTMGIVASGNIPGIGVSVEAGTAMTTRQVPLYASATKAIALSPPSVGVGVTWGIWRESTFRGASHIYTIGFLIGSFSWTRNLEAHPYRGEPLQDFMNADGFGISYGIPGGGKGLAIGFSAGQIYTW